MISWKTRVAIGSAAAALGISAGLWWERSGWNADTRIIADEAELAAAAAERDASLTYSPTQTYARMWTSLRCTNGAAEVWGGYSNVTIYLAGYGYSSNSFLLYRREYNRDAKAFSANRGWYVVYTNATTPDGSELPDYLIDLGPSGGTVNILGNRVAIGGWLLTDSRISAFGNRYATYPGQHISSARFGLCGATSPRESEFGDAYIAGDIDTVTNAHTYLGDVGTPIYWNRLCYYGEDNAIDALPLRATYWGRYNDGAGADYTQDYADPTVTHAPQSPWITPGWPLSLYDMVITENAGSWADYSAAVDDADFTGWPQTTLPGITNHAGYRADYTVWTNFVAGATSNQIWREEIIDALAGVLARRRVRIIGGTWSNSAYCEAYAVTPYRNRADYGSAADFAAQLQTDYETLPSGATWELIGSGVGSAKPEYTLSLQYVWSAVLGRARWQANLYISQAYATALLGHGHATNAADKVAAHIYPIPPTGGAVNTFVRPSTESYALENSQQFAFDALLGYLPAVYVSSDPAPIFTNTPPATMWPAYDHAFTNATSWTPWARGWRTTQNPIVAALLGWTALADHPSITE